MDTLDHLKGAYPSVFKDATEVRTLKYVPGLVGSLVEITYNNGQTRSMPWSDRTDLHEALRKLDTELEESNE